MRRCDVTKGGLFSRRATLAALLGVALLAGCGPVAPGGENKLTGSKAYPTYRYRLTVEVATPQGVRSGSSVIEVRTARAGDLAIVSPRALSSSARGEAVAVDLPGGQILFALLRSDTNSEWAKGGFEQLAAVTPIKEAEKMDDEYGARSARVLLLKGPQVLPRQAPFAVSRGAKPTDPPTAYPMLVRFRDIADPKSVERVDPDALAKSFGPGTTLRSITVERTEDAVTTGIARRLPRADAKGFYNWDGQSNPSDPANTVLMTTDFMQGLRR